MSGPGKTCDKKTTLQATFRPPIVTRSLVVALIVGTVLNGINQGPALLDGEPFHLIQGLLTYCVPFCVASYGSYSAVRAFAAQAPKRMNEVMTNYLRKE